MYALKQARSAPELLAILAIFMCLVSGCDQDNAAPVAVAAQPATSTPIEFRGYVLSLLPDLGIGASAFSASIDTFLENPDQANLEVARNRWLALHHTLVSLDVFCNQPARPEPIRRLWFDLEAWPLEPGYIDSIPEYPNSGIINDLALPISETALRSQHGATSLTEVSTGMHAAEFLLWRRSLEDYEPRNQLKEAERESGLSIDQLSNNRRRELLRLITRLIVEDLALLQPILVESLSLETKALEPNIVVHRDLQAIQRTLMEVQQDTADVHSAYSRSWRADVLTLLHQVTFLVDQQLIEAPQPSGDRIRQSLSDTMKQLSKLDPADTAQLSAALAQVNKLDLQLDRLFGIADH